MQFETIFEKKTQEKGLYEFKLVLVGDDKIGKSCLLKNIMKE